MSTPGPHDLISITGAFFSDEKALARLEPYQTPRQEKDIPRVRERAEALVRFVRDGRRAQQFGGVDVFLGEYGLSNQEGITLMCLAEALLRIPDKNTADAFIREKITGGDWAGHIGHSSSLLVNASTYGLMLTGEVLDMRSAEGDGPSAIVQRLAGRVGEAVVRRALGHAMGILGEQFVLGRSIDEALARATADQRAGALRSYDMLGEAASTMADAERYYSAYLEALTAIGNANATENTLLYDRPGLSVKLSALHPRFFAGQVRRLQKELLPKLRTLARKAKSFNITLTIDAEEADRLDLTVAMFETVFNDMSLKGWPGFGLAVQAYSKRALPVLKRLQQLSRSKQRRIPIRLVKGAYWDTEIKAAQVAGLPDYPVYTRKSATDVSWLGCMRYLFAHPSQFYPQLATHNAHSIAAAEVEAKTKPAGSDFEFQRLHGMGAALYTQVLKTAPSRRVRVYSPVGNHEALLAYLVRRLLENGANTSFVNRLADDNAPILQMIEDPLLRLKSHDEIRNPNIPLPQDLFAPSRKNSPGLPLWHSATSRSLIKQINQKHAQLFEAGPIINGRSCLPDKGSQREVLRVTAPHDHRKTVGKVAIATQHDINKAIESATLAQKAWDHQGAKRALVIDAVADLFEAKHQKARLIGLVVHEGGKTLSAAIDDWRESVDFLRYYAAECRRLFKAPQCLSGPTGEQNLLSRHGRGVFICISPWNFPLAIFVGQIAAALAAGNAVVAKPATSTSLTAFAAVQLFHEAGVPKNALHLLPGSGRQIGASLVSDPRISGVVFTGGNTAAAQIQTKLSARKPLNAQPYAPVIPFIAETGGINAMIADSSALPEQVVADVVESAFNSSGQRCSALRLLFVQDEVADKLLAMLNGAVQELQFGGPLDIFADIPPVINAAAAESLNHAKKQLSATARLIVDHPPPPSCSYGHFVGPAIYEVTLKSLPRREIFGPVLQVIRFASDQLDSVCDAINSLGYGLTLGLHSRITSVADKIAMRVPVGNFYINRNQIGAQVGVQPFGGEGLSGTGPKAGGPHYVQAFTTERVRTTNTTATGGNIKLMTEAAVGEKTKAVMSNKD